MLCSDCIFYAGHQYIETSESPVRCSLTGTLGAGKGCHMFRERREAIQTLLCNPPKAKRVNEEKKPREKSKYQTLVEFFAKNRGVDLSNPALVGKFFAAHGSAAKEILDMAGGDSSEAERAIEEISSHLDRLVLDKKIDKWQNLQAVSNAFIEWKTKKIKAPSTTAKPPSCGYCGKPTDKKFCESCSWCGPCDDAGRDPIKDPSELIINPHGPGLICKSCLGGK